jgi:hypothetical protein
MGDEDREAPRDEEGDGVLLTHMVNLFLSGIKQSSLASSPRSAMRFWKMQLLWAEWDFRPF